MLSFSCALFNFAKLATATFLSLMLFTFLMSSFFVLYIRYVMFANDTITTEEHNQAHNVRTR